MAKIIIYHISDIHWVHSSAPNSVEVRQYQDALIQDFELLDLSKHKSDKKILVLSGDLANFYTKPEASLEDQYEQAFEEVISKIEAKFSPDFKIAIPGNHDLDKTAETDSERFSAFYNIFTKNGWKVSLNEDSVDYCIQGSQKIVFHLFNSALECGKIKKYVCSSCKEGVDASLLSCPNCKNGEGNCYPQERLDPARVQLDKLKKLSCDLGENELLRVAILHHNPLPQSGQEERIVKEDTFTNNGDLIGHLISKNFRLALSGHYHVGSLLFVGKPYLTNAQSTSSYQPFMESGFYSVGAKSFAKFEMAINPGFNLLEIEYNDEENLAELVINEYEFDRSQACYRSSYKKMPLALKSIEQISSDPETSKKMLLNTIKYLYNDKRLPPLNRVLNPNYRSEAFQSLDKVLTGFGELDSVRAMYAVSVLPPESWWANKLTQTFRKYFIKHYTTAKENFNALPDDDLRKGAAGIPLLFKFSIPICSAIDTAKESSRKLYVMGLLTSEELDENLSYEEKAFVKRSIYPTLEHGNTTGLNSLSIWDNHLNGNPAIQYDSSSKSAAPSTANFSVFYEPISNDREILYNFNTEENKKSLEDSYELCRIVLWDKHDFDSIYALHVIQYHEELGVPLFWLSPKHLCGKKGRLRKKIGSLMINALKEERRHDWMDRTVTRNIYTNEKGITPTAKEYYKDATGEGFEYMSRGLWGKSESPEGYAHGDSSIDEFTLLLNRPDIMFAADVWILYKLQKWDEIEKYLEKQQDAVTDWLNTSSL
ncbi:MAG: metallophosphoesterase family protein [Akkermansiaceae bacterium]